MPRKAVRLILWVAGIVVSLYGAVYDEEPVTAAGALLLVLALMFNIFFASKKTHYREMDNKRATKN
jgi:hypothetical protein